MIKDKKEDKGKGRSSDENHLVLVGKLNFEMEKFIDLSDEIDKIAEESEATEEGYKIRWLSTRALSKEEQSELIERSKRRNELRDEVSSFISSSKPTPEGGVEMMSWEQSELFLAKLEEENSNLLRLIELIKKGTAPGSQKS